MGDDDGYARVGGQSAVSPGTSLLEVWKAGFIPLAREEADDGNYTLAGMLAFCQAVCWITGLIVAPFAIPFYLVGRGVAFLYG